MKRWAAIFFDIAAKDSLVLCAVVIGFWVWSYSRAPTATYSNLSSSFTFIVSRGKLALVQELDSDPPETGQYVPSIWVLTTRGLADLVEQMRSQFPDASPPVVGVFAAHRVQYNIGASVVIIPMPLLVATFSVLPLLTLVRRVQSLRRAGRLAAGCCAACGYDLRASPGRCPECGREPLPPAAKKRNFPLTS